MVIKDVLQKLKTADPNDPKVAVLREKLAKIKQDNSTQETPQENKPEPKTPDTAETKPAEKPTGDEEINRLVQASEQERRAYAQKENPRLRVKEEQTHRLVAKQVGELIELAGDMGKRLQKLEQEKAQTKQHIEKLEAKNADLLEKMKVIDGRLEKFMGLYELITNQYNPFSEQEEVQVPSQSVSVSETLSGQEQQVSVQQGEISSENKKKIDQLLRELQNDEKNESTQSVEAQEEIQERQHELADQLTKQLHTLFTSFEKRLQKSLDERVHDKVHETLLGVEKLLDEEVQEAVDEDVDSLKESDSLLSGALEELHSLESSASDAALFAQEEEAFSKEVLDLDKQIKAIPESMYFRLQDGRILTSVDDLREALETISQRTFTHHVTDRHNDFADWLALALKDSRGELLRGKSREEMLAVLSAEE
ncbi:MAG: flagella accessory protein C [Candidatus Woesearchaeota archaeon]